MTEAEPGGVDPDFEPIRVTENIISAWRWDAWRDAAARVDRTAFWVSVVVGTAAALGAALVGYDLIPREGRLSLLLYTPLVGWGVQAWTRSWVATHRLKRVLDEVRPEVVPALVDRIDDRWLLKLLNAGGALVVEQSTRIVAERRDAALALVAYEYDVSKVEIWDAGAGGAG